ncbi:MAG: tRNA (N(6)-L-threonylcarbamoyladenosine(37)-C(2))-methylthiotransferase MtaB [Oscillospiraceae bacterium]|nr:tRNA (N(6)-L-threonylcarbamoyladenosine(37)-C(2))-methylthiotransferase MtaB [Oscillospiraceae bacterium]
MKARFVSLGCKVNQYETQALSSLFCQNGYQLTEGSDADVAIINSCTVTSLADRKTRQVVRRLRREMPNCVIALTGCMPQSSPESAAELTEADIITGTIDRLGILELVSAHLKTKQRNFAVTPFSGQEVFEPISADRFSDSFQRAYLKIEDGCDRFCSYCVIPYARGKVRSRSLFGISSEVEKLVKAGYREIVLTGINISRYGSDIGLTLKDAVAAAAAVEGDFRLRFGSVEPDLLTDEDWLALSKTDKLCPHFHLPVQSGCDNTLAAMNRRYNMAQFFETVEKIRRLFVNPSITADIIVGFPGESDEDFAETCKNIQKLGLLRAHIFEYSPRKGTPAAGRKDQIAPQLKKARSAKLEEICRRSAEQFAAGQVGKKAKVLLEATGGGYTENYLYVTIPDTKGHAPGEIVEVLLTAADKAVCIGEII